MLIVSIHSSSPHLGVALLDQNAIRVEIVLPPGKRHQENLAELIELAFRQVARSMGEADAIVVAKGPGSFSGVRVGLAMAKGMAMGLCKPLFGVSSLEAFAWQGLEQGQTGLSIIDARRNEVYAGVYRKGANDLQELSPPELLSRQDLNGFLQRYQDISAILGDESVQDISQALPVSPSTAIIPLIPSPLACAEIASAKSINSAADELHLLSPLYIRKSDAETNAAKA